MPSPRGHGGRSKVALARNRKLRGRYLLQERQPRPELVFRLRCRRLRCPRQRSRCSKKCRWESATTGSCESPTCGALSSSYVGLGGHCAECSPAGVARSRIQLRGRKQRNPETV